MCVSFKHMFSDVERWECRVPPGQSRYLLKVGYLHMVDTLTLRLPWFEGNAKETPMWLWVKIKELDRRF